MRHVITATEVREARKAGRAIIAVPPGSIITPQARDDARAAGIALTVETAGAAHETRPGISAAARELPSVPSERPSGSAESSASRHEAPPTALEAEVVRRVVAALGGTADPAAIRDIVAQIVASAFPGSPGGGAGEGIGATPARERAGGLALLRDARPCFSDEPPALPDAVLITEDLPPGPEGPGVGHMRFSDTAFEWTFAADEVLVILEGRLELAGEEGTLRAGPGDAVRVAAGATVRLSAEGTAHCVCASWPGKG